MRRGWMLALQRLPPQRGQLEGLGEGEERGAPPQNEDSPQQTIPLGRGPEVSTDPSHTVLCNRVLVMCGCLFCY